MKVTPEIISYAKACMHRGPRHGSYAGGLCCSRNIILLAWPAGEALSRKGLSIAKPVGRASKYCRPMARNNGMVALARFLAAVIV